MRRLILPASLLIAALVGYWRIAGTPEPPPAGSYADLVKATQPAVARRDAGEGLTCAARIEVKRREAPSPDASVPALNVEQLMREANKRDAELDALSVSALLARAKPDELDWALIRRIEQRTARSADEQALWLHFELQGEVENGGFHQYFFNSTGDEALAAREAIARIGPPELLELFDCALTAFPDSKPSRDRDRRNAQLAAWGDAQFELFERLDDAFYALDGLQPARVAFILAPGRTWR